MDLWLASGISLRRTARKNEEQWLLRVSPRRRAAVPLRVTDRPAARQAPAT
jgi:hypothetical protein